MKNQREEVLVYLPSESYIRCRSRPQSGRCSLHLGARTVWFPPCALQPCHQKQKEASAWANRTPRIRPHQVSSPKLSSLSESSRQAGDAIMVTEVEPWNEPGPRIVYVNEAFTEMTGFTSAEVLGKSPRLLQGPRTDPRSKAAIRHALERRQPVCEELLNYRKDGSELWVELFIKPSTNKQGQVTHFVAVQRDVTERRLTEHGLRRSEAQFRQLVDALPQMVWCARPDGTIDYCNQPWQEFTGVGPDATGIVQWESIILDPNDLPRVRADWAASVASGKFYEGRNPIPTGVRRLLLLVLVAGPTGQGHKGSDCALVRHRHGHHRAQGGRGALPPRGTSGAGHGRGAPGRLGLGRKTHEVLWSPEHNAMFDLPIGQRAGNLQEGMAARPSGGPRHVVGEMQAAMLGRRDAEMEMRSVHRDGSLHWIVSQRT